MSVTDATSPFHDWGQSQAKIAVITPYYKESIEELTRAHQSVLYQDMRVLHIMVADGFPNAAIPEWACQHIILPSAHGDAGSFARGVGAMHAFNKGADYVCFLDADNWLENHHVSSLHAVMSRSGADVGVCRRMLRRLDGTVLDPFDWESDGVQFADTGTMMLAYSAIDIAALWSTMPCSLGAAGDQFIWAAINQRGFRIALTELATVNYKTKYMVHYNARGEAAPSGTVDLSGVMSSKQSWAFLPENEKRRIILGR